MRSVSTGLQTPPIIPAAPRLGAYDATRRVAASPLESTALAKAAQVWQWPSVDARTLEFSITPVRGLPKQGDWSFFQMRQAAGPKLLHYNVAAMAAQPVQSFDFHAAAVAQGGMRNGAVHSLPSAMPVAGFEPSLRAEAVESMFPAFGVNSVGFAPAVVQLPALQIAVAEMEEAPKAEPEPVTALCEVWMRAAAAEAVEAMFPAPIAPAAMAFKVPAPRLPELQVSAAAMEQIPAQEIEPALCEIPAPSMAAEPAESLFAIASAPQAILAAAVIQAPAFSLEPTPIEAPEPEEPAPAFCETRMPSLGAEPAAVDVWPQLAEILPAAAQLPAISSVAIAGPRLAASAGWAFSANPEPVECNVRPRVILQWTESPEALALPEIGNLHTADGIGSGPVVGRVSDHAARSLPAAPVESAPSTPPFVPMVAARSLETPGQFAWLPDSQLAGAGFNQSEAHASQPPRVEPKGDAAVLNPLATIFVRTPEVKADQPVAVVPQCGLMPLEFFCHRSTGVPAPVLDWTAPVVGVIPPYFSLRPVFERLEDLMPAKKRKAAGPADVLDISEANRRRHREFMFRQAGKAIAAGIVVTFFLWFGATTQKMFRDTAANSVTTAASRVNGIAGGSFSSSASSAPGSSSSSSSSRSPLAWIRSTIASRAAVELSEGFRNGMDSWGAAAKSFAPGWARHPEGYITPGALALFHPSMSFTDYHLEFFGQIENKGMGWVVRAHDPQNYYAMKVKVIDPGLRPVIAVVHYPVLDGKPGHKVETPLNVMVHRNAPIQVAVDLKGGRVTTSIDGEEVDSFTDNTLLAGGVGFFSDAGERARLYWMKVTKNQDTLGRICSYLSGSEKRTTGELWPAGIPRPDLPTPRPVPSGELAFAVAAVAPRRYRSAGKIHQNRRTAKWNS